MDKSVMKPNLITELKELDNKYKNILIELERRFNDIGTPYYKSKEDYFSAYNQAYIKYEQLRKDLKKKYE